MSDPKTVLLVEDNEDSRALFRHVLEDRGLKVLDFADAESLPEILPAYALALLDHQLGIGRLTGLALASRLKQQYPSVPVVVMSADIQGVSSEQVDAVVQKVGIATLLSVIDKWL